MTVKALLLAILGLAPRKSPLDRPLHDAVHLGEKFPGQKPRIISDNGPQFIAKDFKATNAARRCPIRVCGMTHVGTSPYYPQSNGKLERYHRTIQGDCIRPGTPLSLGPRKGGAFRTL